MKLSFRLSAKTKIDWRNETTQNFKQLPTKEREKKRSADLKHWTTILALRHGSVEKRPLEQRASLWEERQQDLKLLIHHGKPFVNMRKRKTCSEGWAKAENLRARLTGRPQARQTTGSRSVWWWQESLSPRPTLPALSLLWNSTLNTSSWAFLGNFDPERAATIWLFFLYGYTRTFFFPNLF